MDRCITKAECDFCHGIYFLDELVRMTLNYPNDGHDIFNEVLCGECKDYLVAYYWNVAPQLQRYYHPA